MTSLGLQLKTQKRSQHEATSNRHAVRSYRRNDPWRSLLDYGMELPSRLDLRLGANRYQHLNRKATRPMTLERIGVLYEARAMAEILLEVPTNENFANYRRAVISVSRVFDCSFEEATHMIRNLVDKF